MHACGAFVALGLCCSRCSFTERTPPSPRRHPGQLRHRSRHMRLIGIARLHRDPGEAIIARNDHPPGPLRPAIGAIGGGRHAIELLETARDMFARLPMRRGPFADPRRYRRAQRLRQTVGQIAVVGSCRRSKSIKQCDNRLNGVAFGQPYDVVGIGNICAGRPVASVEWQREVEHDRPLGRDTSRCAENGP